LGWARIVLITTPIGDGIGRLALEFLARTPTMPQRPLLAEILLESAMPIYGFECGGCGHRFDRLQKLSDADPTECPECGVAQIRRQLTAPQFRLAGSGWYETDFKKDGDSKRNLVDKSEAAGSAKEAPAGGDKAPAVAASDKTPSKPAESKVDPKSKPAAAASGPAS
jgi:putative FmdB family regulatory protein